MTWCRVVLVGVVSLLLGCAQPVTVPTVGKVDIAEPSATSEVGKSTVLPASYSGELAQLPLPQARQRLFRAGDTNALELPVDAALAESYRAYFAGDGATALQALTEAERESPLKAFHLSAQKLRTLIMMGRAADAEIEAAETASLEQAVYGTDVNAVALRAEARLWLADYSGAEADALAVAAAVRDWVLPHNFSGPPTNMAQIVLLTTAQLRAYTVLAGLYVMQGEAERALSWAESAERGYNTVHTVSADPLYGIYLKSYPESYYGRAFNMLFRGAASAIVTGDILKGEQDFLAARAYFETIGYRAGIVSAAALESWTLYSLGQDRARALAVSEEAVQLAADSGFPDFIWRISALRGEILLNEGRLEEAESAFRRADASVDLVSGALSTDRAKLRYGVGKDTIAYRLARFDIRSGDLNRLFSDLERARARAFVDMLADRPVAPGRSAELVSRIRNLDDVIRQTRIRLMAPRGGDMVGRGAVDRLLAERRDAVEELRRSDPDLAEVHAARTATLDDIRRRLGANDVLAYALPARGSDAVALLIVDAKGARLVETDANADELHRLVVRFREAVTLRRSESQTQLATLIQQRLKFVSWRPRGRLYVVPGGDLFFMPWGALPDVGQTVVLPTGGWLLRNADKVDGDSVGLIGDPEFGGALPQLAGAREEVRRLGDLFGLAPLIDDEATIDALRNRVGQGAKLIHFATHGTFDADEPLKSSLVLTDGARPAPLTAADLFSDPLPADMVVLSACDTGMGKAVAGDDFLGMTRSFYLGGARTVVNSLWPVSDDGAQLFMEVFHRENTASDNPAAAWLAARNRLRADGYPPSVYGAFVVGGAVR